MPYRKTLTTAGLLLTLTAFNAHAKLTSYTGADGAGLVYSSVGNNTWTQDANLLATLENTPGYDTVINAIIAANPTIYDTANYYDTPNYSGYHTVTASDFSTNGYSSWFGAQSFVGYLNSIHYGGSSQWRLPSMGNNPQQGYYLTGSELGQLVYSEIRNTFEVVLVNGSLVPKRYFVNEQANVYWMDTEFAANFSFAWQFGAPVGEQRYYYKYDQAPVWVVSSGQVNTVPLPGAVWMFGAGMLGLLGLKRRQVPG